MSTGVFLYFLKKMQHCKLYNYFVFYQPTWMVFLRIICFSSSSKNAKKKLWGVPQLLHMCVIFTLCFVIILCINILHLLYFSTACKHTGWVVLFLLVVSQSLYVITLSTFCNWTGSLKQTPSPLNSPKTMLAKFCCCSFLACYTKCDSKSKYLARVLDNK